MAQRLTPQQAAIALLGRRKMRERFNPDFVRHVFDTISPGDRYLHNWHIDAMVEYLHYVAIGEINRLIILVPPRYLKSITATTAFPAWLLGNDPTNKILAGSFAAALALEHSVNTRAVIQSEWYRQIFPNTKLAADQNEKRKFQTTERGHRIATSVDGSATGQGGKYLIFDDFLDPKRAHSEKMREDGIRRYRQTFTSRTDDKKNSAIIQIQQRLHVADLAGYVLGLSDDWVVLKLPAETTKKTVISLGDFYYEREVGELLHPEREGLKELDRAKRELGEADFEAQYNQNPILPGGNLIKIEWWRYLKEIPKTSSRKIQVWDTAMKTGQQNAYSVCGTWLEFEKGFLLIDIWRNKVEAPELFKMAEALYRKEKPSAVLIEDKASGTGLVQQMQRIGLPAIPIQKNIDKIEAINLVTPTLQAGNVYLLEDQPWLADFITECSQAPNGAYMDQVDMLTMAVNYMRQSVQIDWITDDISPDMVTAAQDF